MQAITGAKLFSPGKIGYMELRNRTVMAPMVVQLAAENGAVTARSIDYYARRYSPVCASWA
jgi:2,4-dienoyl-CoA reductase-like NADH-dependent reductase (Old Yellow Enzyme family)